MGVEYSVEQALKMAIQAEKESADFYRKAASVARDERARKTFELLAREEIEHLQAFFHHYRGGDLGTFDEYVAGPANATSAPYVALEKAIGEDTHEQQALEIALKEEKATIDRYTVLARDIIDPLVRSIFEKVVKETEKHYQLIESEYAHIMGMVSESDQDIYVRE